MTSVGYLLHMQCYKVVNMQHLIVAECYTSSFKADLITKVRYFITVLIGCYISGAQYLILHMQCC